MATYAMMAGNTVSNIIVADNKEEAEAALNCVLIEYTQENPAGIGYTYDEETGKFNAPAPITDEEAKKAALLQKLGLTQEEFDLLAGN